MGGNKKKNKKQNKTEHTDTGKSENASEEKIENTNDIKEPYEDNEGNKLLEKESMKRHLPDEDSDTDSVKPKKAKKKKKNLQPAGDESSNNKKGKKSIRQMKKEKYAQRQAEAQAAAKDQLKSQCLNYLSQWKHDKQNWKFMKAKQVWLYKNKFSTKLIPDASWPVFLEYFESAQGNIKKMLLDDAHKIIKQMDEWTESHQNGENAEDKDDESADVNKPDENVYNRARSLIQCLQE